MAYKLVPIYPNIAKKETTGDVVTKIETTINDEASSGWQYLHMETVTTWVAGETGCFGIGATPGYNTSLQILVFKK